MKRPEKIYAKVVEIDERVLPINSELEQNINILNPIKIVKGETSEDIAVLKELDQN
jgi:hypothetical protein